MLFSINIIPFVNSFYENNFSEFCEKIICIFIYKKKKKIRMNNQINKKDEIKWIYEIRSIKLISFHVNIPNKYSK